MRRPWYHTHWVTAGFLGFPLLGALLVGCLHGLGIHQQWAAYLIGGATTALGIKILWVACRRCGVA